MKIYELKKGDRIKILKRPFMWSSSAGSCPLGQKFPKIITIRRIGNDIMTCTEGFGWSISADTNMQWKLLSGEENEHFLGFI